jgi:hypothetical protein
MEEAGGGSASEEEERSSKVEGAPPLVGSGRARGRRRRGRGGRGEGGRRRGRRGCGSWGRLRGKCGGRSLRRCSAGPDPVPYGGPRTGRYESLILSHHSRFNVICECNKKTLMIMMMTMDLSSKVDLPSRN